MFTFAILAHNEEPTVARVVHQAQAAAGTGDRIVVADSASTDGTAAAARAAGAEVLAAPVGKGAAMAAIAAIADTEWICFLDADLTDSAGNLAGTLRDAASGGLADQVVGDFEDAHPGTVLSNTVGVYEPLIAALFPEIAERYGSKPLSGFRALRRRFADGFPADFGVEAHLNIHVPMSGGTSMVVPIGRYLGRFRYKPFMGREIGRAVLDAGVRHKRLAPADRPAWDMWVETLVAHIAGYRGEEHERPAFVERLLALARRPLPPRSHNLGSTSSGPGARAPSV